MLSKEIVVTLIFEAFGDNEYPGDYFLQGSFEGSEPYEEAGAFKGKTDWKTLEPALLDAHSSALSMFSEGAFRFFLPAYLVADLRGQLMSAEPLFHLTPFSVVTIKVPVNHHVFTRRTGGATLLNPRRYGAITFADYARYRLSVFTREEGRAIVAYLNHMRESDTHGIYALQIREALDVFWLDRIQHAPSAESLKAHLREESEFVAHLPRNVPGV